MSPESACEAAFARGGPFWHLYTDGGKMEILFASPEDFLFGITLLGICCASFPGCRVLTFSLMNNHLHIVLAGPGVLKVQHDRLRRPTTVIVR